MASVVAAETAVPERRLTQAEVLEACRPAFAPLLGGARAALFDRAGVDTRHFVEPPAYYLAGRPFAERNRDFLRHALPLAERSVLGCLARAGRGPADVSHLVCVTTTGLLTPSLEAHLAQALPFPRTLRRTPLFGAGCAGGAVALARAAEQARGGGDVLALSVELCSLSFRPAEGSMAQLVAAALFGDGACAVLVSGAGGGAEVLGSQSLLLPDSLDVMGWDFDAEGMRLVLSPRAPRLIEEHLPGAVEGFLRGLGLDLGDVGSFLFHPGSARVLDACQRALGLGPEHTRASRRFLARYGNLSSASLLFILKEALHDERPPSGALALAAAFGPGFSCELLLLRFP